MGPRSSLLGSIPNGAIVAQWKQPLGLNTAQFTCDADDSDEYGQVWLYVQVQGPAAAAGQVVALWQVQEMVLTIEGTVAAPPGNRELVLDVNDQFGTTLVLIEHDMGVVMDISDRVVVLDYGRKIADDVPSQIKSNKQVIDAYLGVTH